MANHTGKGTFRKNDPRINRLGRPKEFSGARELAQQILGFKVVSADRQVAKTRIELIFMDWATSKDFRKQAALAELAYGKVPQAVDINATGKMVITVELTDDDE